MRRVSVAAIALAVTCSARLEAQGSALSPGQQVRITAPASGLTGQAATLLSATPDTVVVVRMTYGTKGGNWWVDTTRFAVPRKDISSFEVHGWRSHAAEGALIGGAGLGAMTFLMAEAMKCTGAEWVCIEPGQIGGLTAGAALVGVGIGGLVGMLWRSDAWIPVPLERLSALRIGVAPRPDGRLEVGLTLAF